MLSLDKSPFLSYDMIPKVVPWREKETFLLSDLPTLGLDFDMNPIHSYKGKGKGSLEILFDSPPALIHYIGTYIYVPICILLITMYEIGNSIKK
jgi:hypothetical protein